MAENAFAPITPGEMLKDEFLAEFGLSQNRLAKAIGISPNRIAEIVNNRRRITADTALRLSLYFGNSPEFWLNLQEPLRPQDGTSKSEPRRGKTHQSAESRLIPATRVAEVRQKLVPGTPIEARCRDEMRVGQKNKLTYRWARKGSRPRATHDQRSQSTYLFGAVCPERGTGARSIFPPGPVHGRDAESRPTGCILPWRDHPPAMAAGVTPKLWEMSDMI